jgi:hypothetical protein
MRRLRRPQPFRRAELRAHSTITLYLAAKLTNLNSNQPTVVLLITGDFDTVGVSCVYDGKFRQLGEISERNLSIERTRTKH